jgi:hypothetical protein
MLVNTLTLTTDPRTGGAVIENTFSLSNKNGETSRLIENKGAICVSRG